MSPDDRFNRCVSIVCGQAIEGGFSQDPEDPGGATNHGITLATLSHWRGKKCDVADVQSLQLSEAAAIYRAQYWAAVGGDGLPAGVDLITFDAAVNQGPGTAARFLQQAVNAVQDGHVGPATLAAVGAADAFTLIGTIAEERLADYRGDVGWDRFGKGWFNRVKAVRTTAQAWAKAP